MPRPLPGPDAAGRVVDLWASVDGLIDRAPSVLDLRAHGLHLLAVHRWRELGRAIPPQLGEEEFRSAVVFTNAKAALRRARAACDGDLLVLKGPHTASFYPAPQQRPFVDLDLLAAEPTQAHTALVAAGFVPIRSDDAYYRGLHHLRPLLEPETGLSVEIHVFPNWLSWATPPPTRELFDAAVDDVLGVAGVKGLAPEQHAAVLAMHSWVELPFRRIADLVDVAAVTEAADRAAVAQLAHRWGMSRIWRTTIASADALFHAGPTPTAMRICASNFAQTRDRTVFETHLRRLLADIWARPAPAAAVGLAGGVARTILPAPSETWGSKLSRASTAVRRRSSPSSTHTELLDPSALRAPRMRRR